jgi:hypothetical protein
MLNILKYILACIAISFFMTALMFEAILLKEFIWISLIWIVLLYPSLKLVKYVSNQNESKQNHYK